MNSKLLKELSRSLRRIASVLDEMALDTPSPENVTLADIEKLDKEFLRAVDIAPVLGVNPQDIREQARVDSTKLGFPVIVTGSRVRIPKDGFLYFCRYGRMAVNVKEA